MILQACSFVFTELAEENVWEHKDKDQQVARLAYHYDQLNYIHPFREGNGRAQRLFLNCYLKDFGLTVSWEAIDRTDNDTACRVAVEEGDRSLLEVMFGKALVPLR